MVFRSKNIFPLKFEKSTFYGNQVLLDYTYIIKGFNKHSGILEKFSYI